MCGRATLTRAELGDVAAELEAEVRAAGVVYRPRWNLAPGDQHWIVVVRMGPSRERGARLLLPARWGFPTDTTRLLINARIESAAERPSFRDAYRRRRCLVPTDGFYEWRRADRQPSWYHHADGSLLLMAGLFTSDATPAFTILTMPANEVVAPAHDRMPVLLSPEAARAWLDDPRFDPMAPAVRDQLGRGLVAAAVSTRVNSTAYDGPACLETPAAAPPPRQLRLLE